MIMRSVLFTLLALLALPAPASGEWTCAEAQYASAVCPWFGEAENGLAAPRVAMRWSSDGYNPGSAVGRLNDGIFAIVSLPRGGPSGGTAFLLDIGYEPHWQPDKARVLVPETVTVRLGDKHWRTNAPQRQPPNALDHSWLRYVDGNIYRFTFGPDLVAAMLAASDAAPRTYRDLFVHAKRPGVLRFEIHFRDAGGRIVSSDDIIEIDSGRCEARCQPLLSLAGFTEAYRGSAADADK